MSRHKFSAAQRYAVFSVHGGRCYLDGTPVNLLNMQIDHVIPESMLDDDERLESVKTELGLPSTFQINSYENWLPSCGPCNRRKSSAVFRSTPVIQVELERAALHAERCRTFERQILTDIQVAKLLNAIDRSLGVTAEDVYSQVLANIMQDVAIAFQEPLQVSIGPLSLTLEPHPEGRLVTHQTTHFADGKVHTFTIHSSLGDYSVDFDTRNRRFAVRGVVLRGSARFELGDGDLRFWPQLTSGLSPRPRDPPTIDLLPRFPRPPKDEDEG